MSLPAATAVLQQGATGSAPPGGPARFPFGPAGCPPAAVDEEIEWP
ncbi:hypothetical protein GCM10010358_62780 [Streptomyces minutiscleroticus]|uniref:Uncharacterized protein n=1 Tax=Streptomyces minutiscleroticus TaxID=68238 RepID=A0A918NW00_9ACTN|nr:hypothetical protein GCM10010358_62780 [Streptomyces minutiscleroticus]